MFLFWTEHDYAGGEGALMTNSDPVGAEVQEAKPGAILTNQGGYVLRGVYPTFQDAKRALAGLNKSLGRNGWNSWLALWKYNQSRKNK